MPVRYRALISSRGARCVRHLRRGADRCRSLGPLIVVVVSLWLCASPSLNSAATGAAAADTVPLAAAATSDPMAVVKSGIGQAIAVFQNHQMPLAERRRTLRTLAEQYFDFPMMSRSVLGYHWRALTDEQRAQFVPIFTGFIEAAYLSKLPDYPVH